MNEIEMPCWWDGGQITQTLHGSLVGGGGVQYMPDKGQFGCVLVEIDDKDTDRKKGSLNGMRMTNP